MTQKHTEHHEEHHPHPAPKHEAEKKHEAKHETQAHDTKAHDTKAHDTKAHDTKAHDTKVHEKHETKSHGKSHAGTHYEFQASNLTPENRKYLEEHSSELSKTTLRAKWINQVGEKEDHPGQTLATRNHDVIKHWAEERGGTPATAPGTQHGSNLGVLRINFPGYGGKNLQPVTWQQWFQTFDDRNLVFLFQQKMRNGNQSNFFHMDNPNREHD